MSTINIALLHLWILASQAFYMYLSNKTHMKQHCFLYLVAIPIAIAFPVIISIRDPQAYSLYEYAVVFCMVFAAVADSSLAAAYNREYLTDGRCRSLIYTYFMICVFIAFSGSCGTTVRIVSLFLLAACFLVFSLVKKNSVFEILRGIPLALLSVACSWAFLRFGL